MHPFLTSNSILMAVLLLCGAALAAPSASAGDGGAPLRRLAERLDLHFGAAITPRHLDADVRYGAILAREFNSLTPENAMKFGPLAPEEGRYDFREADRIMKFARTHGMTVRGHTLVWHNQTPAWVDEASLTPEELKRVLRRHIQTVAGRYRGEIRAWDVVNEAFNDDGSLRDTIWLRALGPDYIAMAFRWAHQAAPDARLYYNDYSAEAVNPKSDAIYAMVRSLLAEGVPIHGVGLQMHLVLGSSPSPKSIADNMSRFAELGIDIAVTEMDVRIPKPVTSEKLQEQARTYAAILDTVLEEPACNELTLWGFTDRHSWIPGWFPETDEALIFDRGLEPKPAYYALRDRLQPDDAESP